MQNSNETNMSDLHSAGFRFGSPTGKYFYHNLCRVLPQSFLVNGGIMVQYMERATAHCFLYALIITQFTIPFSTL
jgi:hypothetical protein